MTADHVRAYLDDVGEVDLLEHEEQVDLAKRVQAGAAASRLLADDSERIGVRQRALLRRIVAGGERARQRMVTANLRLVVSMVRRMPKAGCDLLDLVQEGNVGLMRAVDRFDPARGYQFSTYATWWIRQAVQRGTAMSARTVRVPGHVWEELSALRRTERGIIQRRGRRPSDAELARVLGWTAEHVGEIRTIFTDPVSLDGSGGSPGEAPLLKLVADPDAEDPEDHVVDAGLLEDLGVLVDALPDRDRDVVRMRFGLDGKPPRTLTDIGRELDISRERARHLVLDAVEQLRRAAEDTALIPPRPVDPLEHYVPVSRTTPRRRARIDRIAWRRSLGEAGNP